MAHATRHAGWHPPEATLGDEGSIIIRRAPGATYLPMKWSFELDRDIIFERLIHDLYDSNLSFLRELIQNSLDAIRCQLYLDIQTKGLVTPDYPTEVAQVLRDQYAVRVTLTDETATNQLSGEEEIRQVLTVEDNGIGMDSTIAQVTSFK